MFTLSWLHDSSLTLPCAPEVKTPPTVGQVTALLKCSAVRHCNCVTF